MSTILALDAHGGDQGLDVSVPAALNALEADEKLSIILVGNTGQIKNLLDKASPGPLAGFRDRIRIHEADSVIPMDAKPASVLRQGKSSSM